MASQVCQGLWRLRCWWQSDKGDYVCHVAGKGHFWKPSMICIYHASVTTCSARGNLKLCERLSFLPYASFVCSSLYPWSGNISWCSHYLQQFVVLRKVCTAVPCSHDLPALHRQAQTQWWHYRFYHDGSKITCTLQMYGLPLIIAGS